MSKTYQTHDESAAGITDSSGKLDRLGIPADLTGKALLDIGCNEGFFCGLAASRGASRVVGIDFVARNVEFARAKYANAAIEFYHQSWASLPNGPFDVVLWTSAMHYERNPKTVLDRIRQILAPGGQLILECGIAPGFSKEMVLYQRHDGPLWYPTERYLQDVLLGDFAFRRVAPPKQTLGDEMKRSVFHASHRLPLVLLLRGSTKDGKSSMARAIEPTASQAISLDTLIFRIRSAAHQHNDVQRLIASYEPKDGLTELYDLIDERGLTEAYVDMIARNVGSTDQLVVIEGYMTEQQADALARRLDYAIVWDATRRHHIS